MAWLWWAPLAAAVLHVLEEFAWPGGFGAWDRAYRPRIRSSITPRFHVAINSVLVLACLAVGLGGRGAPGSPAVRSAAAGWLTLAALLVANALFHLFGTLRTRRYSPGLVTGLALYVPLAAVGYPWFLGAGLASPGTAVIAAALGAAYPLWASLLHAARSRHARSGSGA